MVDGDQVYTAHRPQHWVLTGVRAHILDAIVIKATCVVHAQMNICSRSIRLRVLDPAHVPPLASGVAWAWTVRARTELNLVLLAKIATFRRRPMPERPRQLHRACAAEVACPRACRLAHKLAAEMVQLQIALAAERRG